MLAEGRRVIANIERVARLFVTKTVYAAVLAVLIGDRRRSVPVLPPPPDHRQHADDRDTGVLPRAGGRHARAPGRLHPPGARPSPSPPGIAAAAATLASYALARVADATIVEGARTAAMLALLAVGLWVLVIVADRTAWRIALVAAMAACVVPLLAIPLARRVFAGVAPARRRCSRWQPWCWSPSRDSPCGAASARPPDARVRSGGTNPPFGMTRELLPELHLTLDDWGIPGNPRRRAALRISAAATIDRATAVQISHCGTSSLVVFITVWNMPRTVDRSSRRKDAPVVMANVLSEKEQAEQRERDHAHGPGDGEPVSVVRPADHAERADRRQQAGEGEPGDQPRGSGPAGLWAAGAVHHPGGGPAVPEPDGLDGQGGEAHPQRLQGKQRFAACDVEDAGGQERDDVAGQTADLASRQQVRRA